MRRALIATAVFVAGAAAAWWALRALPGPPGVAVTASAGAPVALSEVRVRGALDDQYAWELEAVSAAADPASQTVRLEGVRRAELFEDGIPLLAVEAVRLTTNRLTRDVESDAPVTVRTPDGGFTLESAGFRWDARARQLRFAGPVRVVLSETVVDAAELVWEVPPQTVRAGGTVALAGPWGHAQAAALEFGLDNERFVLQGPVRGALVWPAGAGRVARLPSLPETLRSLLLRAEGSGR